MTPGLTDSIATIAGEPKKCANCGATTKLSEKACAACLLRQGLDPDREASGDTFGSILSEVELADKEWRLGNYEILEEIGRGGMGVIYRARQRHSRRIVAVKRILSYHTDSKETLERFRREAQAAASLDHPNILPIYEIGESDDSLPFFSMKYASGGSLRDAAHVLRADTHNCVALLAKVSRAIQYAHGQGILHRDLKPGNILLDSRGEPLVGDFGLAKWLDTNTDLTRTVTIFGTPGYIAPEQAYASATQLTPAADVYSLGAILFDFVARRPPFIGAHAWSVIRQASEKPAPKLRTLSKLADRDLETICAKCLEREPGQRYQSAGAVADDLERWLQGRPIKARRVLPSTRAWRWSRRNPQIIATAVICLMLGAAALWLTRRAATERPIVTTTETLETKRLRSVLANYPILQLREWHASQPGARIREAVFRQLAKEAQLPEQFVRSELPKLAEVLRRRPDISPMEAGGAAFVRKDYVEAERFALQAADSAKTSGLPSEVVHALTIASMAAIQHQEAARALEHAKEAEQLADPQRSRDEWLNPRLVHLLALVQQRHLTELETCARSLIADSSRIFGPEAIETSRTRSWLALSLFEQRRNQDEIAELREMVRMKQKVLGSENPETITAMWALAVSLSVVDSEASETEHRRVYDLRKKILGPDHPDTIRSRNALAGYLGDRDPEAALAEYRAISQQDEKLLGRDDLDTVRALLNTGVTLGRDLRRFDEAERVLHEVVTRADRAVAANSGFPPEFAIYTHNLHGVMRSDAGKYAEAEQAHREALRLIEKSFGPEHPLVQSSFPTRSLLTFALDAQARHAEAEDQIRQAISLQQKDNAEPRTDLLVFLTTNLWYQGRFAEAEKEARRAVATAEKEGGTRAYGRDNNKAGLIGLHGPLFCRMLLANALRDQLKYAEAEAEYRQVIEKEEKVIGPSDRCTLESYYNFAYQLAQQDRLSEARDLARCAVAGVARNYPNEHPCALRYRALLSKIEAGEPITISDPKFRDALVTGAIR